MIDKSNSITYHSSMNTSYGITSKGQITLPKALREAIGLTTEHRVSFERRGDEIVIRKEPTLAEVSERLQRKFRASGLAPATQADYEDARRNFHEQGGIW